MEFDPLKNQDILRSIGIPNAPLEFPLVVRFGDHKKRDYTITKLLQSDSKSVLYEAYYLRGDWMKKVPVIIKAYTKTFDSLGENNYWKAYFDDLALFHKKSRIMNSSIRYGVVALEKFKGYAQLYLGTPIDQVSEPIRHAEDQSAEAPPNISRPGIYVDTQKKSEAKVSAINFEEDSQESLKPESVSNAKAIKSLWNPKTVRLPISILIGDINEEEFVVERHVGTRYLEEIYEGYFASDPSKLQTLNVFFGVDRQMVMKFFEKDFLVLKRLGRLVKSDDLNTLIVEEQLEGEIINNLLSKAMLENNQERYNMLLNEYKGFPQTLKEKYGLDVSIHPFNVIVDQYNRFHLLDVTQAELVQDEK